MLAIKDEKLAGQFQRALQADYPMLGKTHTIQIAFEASSPEPQVQQEPFRWVFSDVTGSWSVVLATDFLALETRAYTTFGEFLSRFRRAVEACTEIINAPFVTRLGLRYINELREPGMPWSEMLRPELLGVLVSDIGPKASRVVGEAQLVLPGSEFITLRYGLLPTGTAIPPLPGEPAAEGPVFLLDIDAYRDAAVPNTLPWDVNTLAGLLADYHGAIHRLFHWSITPKYIASLGQVVYAS